MPRIDVVPVAGQAWNPPSFRFPGSDGRLYGRGTATVFRQINYAREIP